MIETERYLPAKEEDMHESERHRVILSAIQDRPVVTVAEFCEMTGASEATIRRDIASLHMQKKLRRGRPGRRRNEAAGGLPARERR